jgi:peptidoglycan-associated lipoprotein
MMVAAGCKKKAPAPPPPPPPRAEEPPPPKPAAPTIAFFQAEPSSIQAGQSSTLRWSVKGADSISIDNGIGTVQADGQRQVYPNQTTTYTLRATGPGGSTQATARVTVTQPPPPPPPPPAAPKLSLRERLEREVQDVYFDYDKYSIREDARSQLTRNADALKAIMRDFPNDMITIEGHCDERGSAEYNLGLGDRRATAAKDFLVQLGVPAGQLRTVSYGKERPQCTESNESCWQRNRRAHFSAGQ